MSGIAIEVEAKIDRAQRDLATLHKTVGGISSEVKKATSSFNMLSKAAIGIGSLAFVLPTIKSIDAAFTSIENKIKSVTTSTQQFNKAYGEINQIAKDTRTTVSDTTDSFFRIAASLSDSSLDVNRVLIATKAIQSAAALAGGSMDSYRSAIMQLGQGLGAGALRGEEFNSVIEQALPLAKAIGDALGVNVGTLRRMANAGKLTSDVVFNAMAMQANALQKKVQDLGMTLDQAFRQFGETVKGLFSSFDKALKLSAALSSVLVKIASKLQELSDSAFEFGVNMRVMLSKAFDPTRIAEFMDFATTIFYPFYFAAKLFSKQFIKAMDAYGVTTFVKSAFAKAAFYISTMLDIVVLKLYTVGSVLRIVDQKGFLQGKIAALLAFSNLINLVGKTLVNFIVKYITPYEASFDAFTHVITQTFAIIPLKVTKIFSTHMSNALNAVVDKIFSTRITFIGFVADIAKAFEDFSKKLASKGITKLNIKALFEEYKAELFRYLNNDVLSMVKNSTNKIKASTIGLALSTKHIGDKFSFLGIKLKWFSGFIESLYPSFMKVSSGISDAKEKVNEFTGSLDAAPIKKFSDSFSFSKAFKTVDSFISKLTAKSAKDAGVEFVENVIPVDTLNTSANKFKKAFGTLGAGISKISGSLFSSKPLKANIDASVGTIRTALSSFAELFDAVIDLIAVKVLKLVERLKEIEKVGSVLGKVSSIIYKVKNEFNRLFGNIDFSKIVSQVSDLFINVVPTAAKTMVAKSEAIFTKLYPILVNVITRVKQTASSLAKTIDEFDTQRLVRAFEKVKGVLEKLVAKVVEVKNKATEVFDSLGVKDIVINFDVDRLKERAAKVQDFFMKLFEDIRSYYINSDSMFNIDFSSIQAFKESLIKAFEDISSLFSASLAKALAKPVTLQVTASTFKAMFPEGAVATYIGKQMNSIAKSAWQSFIIEFSKSAEASTLSEKLGSLSAKYIGKIIQEYIDVMPSLAGAILTLAGGMFRGFVQSIPIVGKLVEGLFNIADFLGVAGPIGAIGAFLFGKNILATLAEIGFLPKTLTGIIEKMGIVGSFFRGSYGRRDAMGGFESIFGTISNTFFNSKRRAFSVGATLLAGDMLGVFDSMFAGSDIAHSVARGLAAGYMLFGRDVPKLVMTHVVRPMAAALVMSGGLSSSLQSMLLSFLRGDAKGSIIGGIASMIDTMKSAIVSRVEGVLSGQGIFNSLIYGRTGSITVAQQASSLFRYYETAMRTIEAYASLVHTRFIATNSTISSIVTRWTTFSNTLASSTTSGGILANALLGRGGLVARLLPIAAFITLMLASAAAFADEAESIPQIGKDGQLIYDAVKAPEIKVNKASITEQVTKWMETAADGFKKTFPILTDVLDQVAKLPNRLLELHGMSAKIEAVKNIFLKIFEGVGPALKSLFDDISILIFNQLITIGTAFSGVWAIIKAFITGLSNLGQLVGDTVVTYLNEIITAISAFGTAYTYYMYFIKKTTGAAIAEIRGQLLAANFGLFLTIVAIFETISKRMEEFNNISEDTMLGKALSYFFAIVGVLAKLKKILIPVIFLYAALKRLLEDSGKVGLYFHKILTAAEKAFEGISFENFMKSPLATLKAALMAIPNMFKEMFIASGIGTAATASASTGRKLGELFMKGLAGAITNKGFFIVTALAGVLTAAYQHITSTTYESVDGFLSFIEYFFDLTAAGLAMTIGSFLLLGKSVIAYKKEVKEAMAVARAEMVLTGAMAETSLAARFKSLWLAYQAPLLGLPALMFSRLVPLMALVGSVAAGAFAGAFVANVVMGKSDYSEIGIMIGTVAGWYIGRYLMTAIGAAITTAFGAFIAGIGALALTLASYITAGLYDWFGWSDDFLTQLGKIWDKLMQIAKLAKEPPDPKTGLSKQALDYARYKGFEIKYDLTGINKGLLSDETKKNYEDGLKAVNDSLEKARLSELDTGALSKETKDAIKEFQGANDKMARRASKAAAESSFNILKDYQRIVDATDKISKSKDLKDNLKNVFEVAKPLSYRDIENNRLLGKPTKQDTGGIVQQTVDAAKKAMEGADFSPKLSDALNKKLETVYLRLEDYNDALAKGASSEIANAIYSTLENTLEDVRRLTALKNEFNKASAAVSKYNAGLSELSTNLKKYDIEFDTTKMFVPKDLKDSLEADYQYLLEIDNQLAHQQDENARKQLINLKNNTEAAAKYRIEMAKIAEVGSQYQASSFNDLGIEIPDAIKYLKGAEGDAVIAKLKELKQLQFDVQSLPPVQPVTPEADPLWSQRTIEERRKAFEAYAQQSAEYSRKVAAQATGEFGLDKKRNEVQEFLFDTISSNKEAYNKFIGNVIDSIGSPAIDIINQYGQDAFDTAVEDIARTSLYADIAKRLGDYKRASSLLLSVESMKNNIKAIDVKPLQATIDLLETGVSARDVLSIPSDTLDQLVSYGKQLEVINKKLENARKTNSPEETKGLEKQRQNIKRQAFDLVKTYKAQLPSAFSGIFSKMGIDGKTNVISNAIFKSLSKVATTIENLDLERTLKADTIESWLEYSKNIETANNQLERIKLTATFTGEEMSSAFSDAGLSDFNQTLAYSSEQLTNILKNYREKQTLQLDIKQNITEKDLDQYIKKITRIVEISNDLERQHINTITTGNDVAQSFSDVGVSTSRGVVENFKYARSVVEISKKVALLKLEQSKPLKGGIAAAQDIEAQLLSLDRLVARYKKIMQTTKEGFESFKSLFEFNVEDSIFSRLSDGILGLMQKVAARFDLAIQESFDKEGLSKATRDLQIAKTAITRDAKTYSSLLSIVAESQKATFTEGNKARYEKVSSAFPKLGVSRITYGTMPMAEQRKLEERSRFTDVIQKIDDLGALPAVLADKLTVMVNQFAAGKNVTTADVANVVERYGDTNLVEKLRAFMKGTEDPFSNLKSSTDTLTGSIDKLNTNVVDLAGAVRGEKKLPVADSSLGTTVKDIAEAAAAKYQVPANIVKAIVAQESRGKATAVSEVGAKGAMQLMPYTAHKYGVTDPFNMSQSIDAGTHYLKDLYNNLGDWDKAIAGYFEGEAGARKMFKNPAGYPKGTRYLKEVKQRMGQGANEILRVSVKDMPEIAIDPNTKVPPDMVPLTPTVPALPDGTYRNIAPSSMSRMLYGNEQESVADIYQKNFRAYKLMQKGSVDDLLASMKALADGTGELKIDTATANSLTKTQASELEKYIMAYQDVTDRIKTASSKELPKLQTELDLVIDGFNKFKTNLDELRLAAIKAGDDFRSNVKSSITDAFKGLLKGESDANLSPIKTFFNKVKNSVSDTVVDTFTKGLLDKSPLKLDKALEQAGAAIYKLPDAFGTLFSGGGFSGFTDLFGGTTDNNTPEGTFANAVSDFSKAVARFVGMPIGGAGAAGGGLMDMAAKGLPLLTAGYGLSKLGLPESWKKAGGLGVGNWFSDTGVKPDWAKPIDTSLAATGQEVSTTGMFSPIVKATESIDKFTGKAIMNATPANSSAIMPTYESDLSWMDKMWANMKSGLAGIFGDNGFFSGLLSNIGPMLSGIGSFFGFASGGSVKGPGTSTSDSIPAMLSNGEFIVNARAATKHRGLLDAINSGQVPRLSLGGAIGDASANILSMPSRDSASVVEKKRTVNNSSNQSVINLNITGDISRQTRTEIFKMMPSIANGVNTHNKEQNYKG